MVVWAWGDSCLLVATRSRAVHLLGWLGIAPSIHLPAPSVHLVVTLVHLVAPLVHPVAPLVRFVGTGYPLGTGGGEGRFRGGMDFRGRACCLCIGTGGGFGGASFFPVPWQPRSLGARRARVRCGAGGRRSRWRARWSSLLRGGIAVFRKTPLPWREPPEVDFPPLPCREPTRGRLSGPDRRKPMISGFPTHGRRRSFFAAPSRGCLAAHCWVGRCPGGRPIGGRGRRGRGAPGLARSGGGLRSSRGRRPVAGTRLRDCWGGRSPEGIRTRRLAFPCGP